MSAQSGPGSPSGDGSGAVFFSAAPEPDTTDPVDAAGQGQTGWPWFLPQSGLRRDLLESAADVDQDPAGAAAVYAGIPLVHGAVRLLEHVGEGCEVTSDGALPLADVRALVVSWQLDLGGQELTSMWQVGEVVGPWNALVSGGWLELSSTWVGPGEGMAPAVPQAEEPAAFVRFARALILLLLLDVLKQSPEDGGLFGDPDTFAALMHTVEPEGLLLPAEIRIALDRGLVPEDPGGDPDMDEIQRYWRAQRDLTALAAYGLLSRETSADGQDTSFHGAIEVIVEAFGAQEILSELDEPQ
ncbi:hypothetical protein CFK39_10915 [Brachybacterium avium]|uniref:Uncharacterized protein n=2 Tax=Brachybacterium avium TaxID=2017485 RepID=A0A220UDF2_9MICO|nr:hypothetical protein CFK39_10915 [Brachybacterium avium]